MTDELKALLEKTRGHVMTPCELFEQRVSFVYAQQDWSSGVTRSKEAIRSMMVAEYGDPCRADHTLDLDNLAPELLPVTQAYRDRAAKYWEDEPMFAAELLQGVHDDDPHGLPQLIASAHLEGIRLGIEAASAVVRDWLYGPALGADLERCLAALDAEEIAKGGGK